MRIGFKYGAYEKEKVGINRCIYDSVNEILKTDKNNEYISIDPDYLGFDIGSIVPDYLSMVKTINEVDMSSIFLDDIDLIHSWFNPIHMIDHHCFKLLTIYDVIGLLHPEWFPPATNDFFKNIISKSVRCADCIITISEQTKSDVVNCYNVNPDKVKVIYLGLDSSLQRDCSEDITSVKYGLDNYVLSVCTLEPRKNLRGLISGFVSFKREHPTSTLKLVLTGKKGWDYEFDSFMKSLGKYGEDIVRTGYVSDMELASLYKNALAFAYVSFYEGFGLPVLEAMAANKAVICSDKTSIPEVGGDAVQYCDPYNVESISSAIEKVVMNEDYRKKLEDKAGKRANLFSYHKCALEHIDIYNSFK